ncbi:MAG: class I SAM-dependent methyltransferase [Deltaproteobacteria bacterium]|nr:class I SAM-dependent methyltransferase [Deltaproteobacteria bacterium]
MSAARPGADITYWKKNARRYDRFTLFCNRRFSAMATRAAEVVDGSLCVLEVAAGTGLVTTALSARVKELVATDRSGDMLDVLCARLKADGRGAVEVRTADALALDFADGTFDAVVAANLVHLLPEPSRFFSEARRVLKSEGVVVLPTFCHGDTLGAHIVSRLLRLTGFPLVTRFNRASLRALIEANGFSVTTEERFPGLLPIWLMAGRKQRP